MDAWAAANRHETCCARLDNFDWVFPPYDLAMMLPRPELDDESSDVERDVCDVPDEFPVGVDKTALDPLGLPVVDQTKPQVGCDPDFESADIRRDVCDVPDEFPVSTDKTAVEPLGLLVVAQTRLQVGCDPDLPLPMDKGKKSLVEDGLDVIVSGRMLNVKISDVSRGICAVPDQLPVAGAASLTCGRYDEITGWLCTGLDLACG